MVIMLKTALSFTIVVVMPSTCAFIIKVKECPVTETAWEARSHIVICTFVRVYHCIQTEEGELIETCMIPEAISPDVEDGCPWAYHHTERGSFLGVGYHPCQGNGCPQRNDSVYWTNQLYKHPKCLRHYEETTEVTESTKSVLDVTTTACNGLSENGDTVPSSILAVFVAVVTILTVLLTTSVVVNIMLFMSRARGHKGKSNGYITEGHVEHGFTTEASKMLCAEQVARSDAKYSDENEDAKYTKNGGKVLRHPDESAIAV